MVEIPRIKFDVNARWQQCFGCGQENPLGLKLIFRWDGERVRTEYTAPEYFQGWKGVLHGGITTLLLDEAMGWATLYKKIATATAEMTVKLKKPIPINEPLLIEGWVEKQSSRIVSTRATLTLKNGIMGAESHGTMFVVDKFDLAEFQSGTKTENDLVR